MPQLPDIDIGDPNDPTVKHVLRFRLVSREYPLIVTKAYAGDLEAAAKDDEETVAGRVRLWESSQGISPRNWVAIGHAERTGDPNEPPAG